MKVREIYDFVVEYGQKMDPRGKDGVIGELHRIKESYERLGKTEKDAFDAERLSNPYADTRILVDDESADVQRIMVGIDIDVGEIVLADRLRERGEKIDLVIAHHPSGRALAGLHHVMQMQADILHRYGVPINVGEGLLEDRIDEVHRRLMPANHTRAEDAARLLGVPLMCMHTPTDNCVASYLQGLFDEKRPETVGDVLSHLRELPEYQNASANNVPATVVAGKESRRAGKILVDMTGGTSGSKEIYAHLESAGVGTLVGMHIGEDHYQEVKKRSLSVIIAGHISSDTLGVNLMLDALAKKIPSLEVVECSGFRRVSRS